MVINQDRLQHSWRVANSNPTGGSSKNEITTKSHLGSTPQSVFRTQLDLADCLMRLVRFSVLWTWRRGGRRCTRPGPWMQNGHVSSHVCRLHPAVLHISGVLCRRENHICETVTRGWRSVLCTAPHTMCFKETCWMTSVEAAKETSPELYPGSSGFSRVPRLSFECCGAFLEAAAKLGPRHLQGRLLSAARATAASCSEVGSKRLPARTNSAGALMRSGIDFPTWVWVGLGPGSAPGPVQNGSSPTTERAAFHGRGLNKRSILEAGNILRCQQSTPSANRSKRRREARMITLCLNKTSFAPSRLDGH